MAGTITLVLFFIILFLGFADQSLLFPLVNPLLLDFFQNTSNVVPLGWITFTFTVLSAFSMIIAGIYADRKSRIKLCFAGCLVYGVFSTASILIPEGRLGYIFFFASRALNGVGIGVLVPTIYSLVGDTVSPRRRAAAFGYMSAAVLVGRMAGFLVAGSAAGNWRMAYFSVGVISLVFAFSLLFVKEPERGAQDEELHDVISKGAEYRFRISRQDTKLIRSNKSNFWLIVNFIDVFPGAILIFLIFKYMKDVHNMEPGTVNFVVFVVVVLGAAGALFFGRLGDWGFQRDKRAKVIIALFCNAFPIVFMIFFLKADFWIPAGTSIPEALKISGVLPLILVVGLAVFINQGVNPNWYSSLTDINLPEHRSTIISLASVMDMLGQALGPLIASYTAAIWGLKTAMWSIVIFWGLNIVFWIPVLLNIRKDLNKLHLTLARRAEEMKSQIPDAF